MQAVPVVFCERTGEWAAAWRRLAAGRLGPSAERWLPVVETRVLSQCREVWDEAPAAFFAVELASANLDQALDFLVELATSHTRARSAVLTSRSLATYEGLARELGAVHVAYSPRRLDVLLPIAQRHLAAAPHEPLPILDRIWRELPWERAATRDTMQVPPPRPQAQP